MSTAGDAPVRQPGWNRALKRLFMKQVRVLDNVEVADGLRVLTLQGPPLQNVEWLPGQKLQVGMGSGFMTRTYTPFEWDATAGRTRLVGVTRAGGPGTRWIGTARSGDVCEVLGPRSSIDVQRVDGPMAVLGDDTSLGVALALARHAPGRVECLFESTAGAALRAAGTQLGLRDFEVLGRAADDSHLASFERRLPAWAGAGAGAGVTFVLTGRAVFIQRLRRALRELQVPAARLRIKAYWSAGKTGLD